MKPTKTNLWGLTTLSSSRLGLCSVTFSLLVATPAAYAASGTWSATPADALWATGANWSASPVPGVGDTATFGASTGTTIDTGNISLSQIAISSTTGYTIGSSVGTGQITFADGTTTALSHTGQSNTTINANIILGTAVASITTFTSAVNRTTTLAGSITGGTGGTAAAKTLTLIPTSNGGSFVTVSGAISNGGASSLAISKSGTGTVNLTNASNNFTGGLTALSGTFNVSSLGALGSATTGLISLGTGNQSPGVLNFTGSPGSLSRLVQIGSGAGTGGATINNNATNGSSSLIFTNATFNLQTNNGSAVTRILTLGGANTDANEIQGFIRNNTGAGAAVAVTKADAGTWTLSGANSYTGATNVNGGKLIINGNISTSSLTTVAAAGTLGGSGTVGRTVVNGTLAVGNSPGQMNFTDTLSLAGTSTTIMEIDGTLGAGVTNGHDFVNLTGSGATGQLTYGGAMTIDIGVIFATGTYAWNLFDMVSETGTFGSITLADQYSGSLLDTDLDGVWDLTSGDNIWQFTESTGVLGLTTVIPEPSAAILLGSLGMLALGRRRRA
jgi:autotransporter-associated beta strand protein